MPQQIPHPIQIQEKNRFVKVLYFLAGVLVVICALLLFYIYVPLIPCIMITVAAFPLILIPVAERLIKLVEKLVKEHDCWNEDESINYKKIMEKIIDNIRLKTPFIN